MKTTIEIADPVLDAAKQLAAREGTTLRALVEEALRGIVEARRRPQAFTLRDATFRGGAGLQPEFADAGWERIRDAAYGGRGA